jgi:D-sedoheptulose 7-phosphate isomerase
MKDDAAKIVAGAFRTTAANFEQLAAEHAGAVVAAAGLIVDTLKRDNKVMFCGNGGSAADAQHLAAELMGRYLRDRAALAAIALTVDTSALTAIGNDFGFADIFGRQVRGIGRKGDVLVCLSTSGNSVNILSAIAAARDCGIAVVGLTGARGGKMVSLCDLIIRVPSDDTPRVQEMHIAVGHMICELVENAVA